MSPTRSAAPSTRAKSLTVDNVTFAQQPRAGRRGDLVQHPVPGQTLTVPNSRFTGNEAKEIVAGTTATHVGGAIGIAENCANTRTQPVTVTITDSDFFGNSAQANGVSVVNARGGAIFSNADADVTITRTIIEANQALPPITPNANVNSLGGGISGGGEDADDSRLRDLRERGGPAHRAAPVQRRGRATVLRGTLRGARHQLDDLGQ